MKISRNVYSTGRALLFHATILAIFLGPELAAQTPGPWVLPSAVYRTGANGAEFHSDVRILNQNTGAVMVQAAFYDQTTGQTLTATPFPVAARNQAAFDNVLQSLFGRTLAQGSYGPIRFSASAPVVIASSVNNVNACGVGAISGQWLPAIYTAQAMKAGNIGQLAVSSSPSAGYRTNLVFMNPGPLTATVTAKVRTGGNSLLSSGTIGALAMNGFSQIALDAPTVFPGVAGMTDTNLWLEFASDQPVLAFASVINNASGDPFAVVAVPDYGGAAPIGVEITETLPGGVTLVMERVPAGTFYMGSPETEVGRRNTETLHQVTLTSDYYMGKYLVTQGQWKAVMGTPMPTTCTNIGIDDSFPVYCVSWMDVAGPGGFIEKLNATLATTKYRLPTEAEWERAARGGTQTTFFFGDGMSGGLWNEGEISNYMWWGNNSSGKLHPVGTKMPNQYQLYDTSGQVYEWVQDWFDLYPPGPATNPTGPTTGPTKMFRGGYYVAYPDGCRAAQRGTVAASERWTIGFRLARSL